MESKCYVIIIFFGNILGVYEQRMYQLKCKQMLIVYCTRNTYTELLEIVWSELITGIYSPVVHDNEQCGKQLCLYDTDTLYCFAANE